MGLVSLERGISIRFPRFIKIRDPEDKGIELATSADQLAEMYLAQSEGGGGSGSGSGKQGGEEEEVDRDE